MAEGASTERQITRALRKRGTVSARTECGLYQELELKGTVPVTEFKQVIRNPRQFRVKRKGRTGELELSLA